MNVMRLAPGSVTPLGILNDEARKVIFFIDEAFFTQPALIGVHPNDNTATVWLQTDDLIAMIQAHGNQVIPFQTDT